MSIELEPGVYCNCIELKVDENVIETDLWGLPFTLDFNEMEATLQRANGKKETHKILKVEKFSVLFERFKM